MDTAPCGILKVVDDADISKRQGEAAGELSDSEEEGEEHSPFDMTVDLPKECEGKYRLDVLDLPSLTWSTEDTHGVADVDIPHIPHVGTGSTLSYHEGTNSMYLYGGWNNHQFSSDVYCISLDTWKWEQISVPKGSMKPSPRYLTGVLVHGDKLCNFGGVGPDITRDQDQGAEYHGCEEKNVTFGYGWNNEYYEFDLIEGKWVAPMSGTNRVRPPPVSAHVFTKFDNHRALCYGGRTKKGWTDDTWIFNLDSEAELGDWWFHPQLLNSTRPPHRTLMTLCPLIDPEMVGQSLCPGGPPMEQTLLLLWGRKTPHLVVDNCWLFHCKDRSWSKISLGEMGRFWHIGCPYFCEPGKTTECQVVVYGGCRHASSVDITCVGVKDLTILSFGTKSLQKLCLSVIVGALDQCGVPHLHQFPDYVPTASKQAILDSYLAHAHTTAYADRSLWSYP